MWLVTMNSHITFVIQTLLEIEYTVSLGLLNASKAARVQRIHGHFLSFKMEDGTEMDLHKLVVKMAFQKASFFDALKKHLFFAQFMNYFFEACESKRFKDSNLSLQN